MLTFCRLNSQPRVLLVAHHNTEICIAEPPHLELRHKPGGMRQDFEIDSESNTAASHQHLQETRGFPGNLIKISIEIVNL